MTSEFISGGYFIVTRAKRPDYLSLRVPQTFVTLSSCLTCVAPDLWAVDWEDYGQQEREEEAAKFGIPPSGITELVEWTTPRMDFPIGFSSIEDAQGFRRLSSDNAVIVVGIGLHDSLIASFKRQLEKESNKGLGLLERLERRETLRRGGVELGFEPLGFNAMHFHSWLCNYAPEEIEEPLAVRMNENDLFGSLADGIRVTNFVREHGEQAIWEPWLVVEYLPQNLSSAR